jgi:putative 4-mercaptohistidine N1-methyltranferase
MAAENYYETDRALSEYLLFHYGAPDQLLLPGFAMPAVPSFHCRCVSECLDAQRLPPDARALDIGCAVGRASFELSRHCSRVVGVDFSERFIGIAGHLGKNGSFLFGCVEEGELTRPCQAVVPDDIDRNRVQFERGDATAVRADLGAFDVVLMANLIDRLNDPRRCLALLPGLVKPGGQLIITSPCTWLTEYTPRENWLGGFERDGKPLRTFDALKEILSPHFQFSQSKDLPFLIREHARKFQLAVAMAGMWIRK